jgi:hypothetical protein
VQAIAIYELIGEQHDVLIHSVLVSQVDDRMQVSLRQPAEKRHIEAAFASPTVFDLLEIK